MSRVMWLFRVAVVYKGSGSFSSDGRRVRDSGEVETKGKGGVSRRLGCVGHREGVLPW